MSCLWLIRVENRTVVALQIHIRVIDANDNAPIFSQKRYQVSVMENLRLDPPAPIVKVHAEDLDEGKNGAVRYSIISGNDGGEYTYRTQVHNILVYFHYLDKIRENYELNLLHVVSVPPPQMLLGHCSVDIFLGNKSTHNMRRTAEHSVAYTSHVVSNPNEVCNVSTVR
jgi:hypothetical protein